MNMMMVGSGITPYVQQGKLRALAVTSAERLPALPNVPTFTELGYPNVNVQTFAGVVAPAGTPKDGRRKAAQRRRHGGADARGPRQTGEVQPIPGR